MTNMIKLAMDDFIRREYSDKPELRDFLIDHERKGKCVDNLAKELKETSIRNPKLLKNNEYIKTIICEFVKVFCDLAIKTKEMELLTDAQKVEKLKEAERIREIERMSEMFSDKTKLIV